MIRRAKLLGRVGLTTALAMGFLTAGTATRSDAEGTSTAGSRAAQSEHVRVGAPVIDGRIVMDDVNSFQIDTVNPDGTALVQVTHFPRTGAIQPHWLADDSAIVFVRFL